MATASEMEVGPIKVPAERLGLRQPQWALTQMQPNSVINSSEKLWPEKVHWANQIPFQECENTHTHMYLVSRTKAERS